MYKKEEMPIEEIERIKRLIDSMSHEDMARAWRFSPSGNPMFRSDTPLAEYFQARFKSLGGWTSKVSKTIGL